MTENFDIKFYFGYVKVFKIFSEVSTTVALIISIFAIKIIYSETSKTIKTYKILLLAYMILQIIFGIYFLVFKCIFFLPFPFFMTLTSLEISSKYLTISCATFELWAIICLADLLLAMFIERYYFMTRGIIHRTKFSQAIIFGGIFFTNFALLFSYVGVQIFGEHLFSHEKSTEFVITNFNNSREILTLPNLAVSDIFFRVSTFTIFFMVFVFIFIFTRTIGYFYFTYKNITCLKMIQKSINSSQNKHNANAIKNLFIQLMNLIIFGCLPNTICILLFIFKIPTFQVYIYLECLFHRYFLVDVICTLLFIRPYRNALIKFIGAGNNSKVHNLIINRLLATDKFKSVISQST